MHVFTLFCTKDTLIGNTIRKYQDEIDTRALHSLTLGFYILALLYVLLCFLGIIIILRWQNKYRTFTEYVKINNIIFLNKRWMIAEHYVFSWYFLRFKHFVIATINSLRKILKQQMFSLCFIIINTTFQNCLIVQPTVNFDLAESRCIRRTGAGTTVWF